MPSFTSNDPNTPAVEADNKSGDAIKATATTGLRAEVTAPGGLGVIAVGAEGVTGVTGFFAGVGPGCQAAILGANDPSPTAPPAVDVSGSGNVGIRVQSSGNHAVHGINGAGTDNPFPAIKAGVYGESSAGTGVFGLSSIQAGGIGVFGGGRQDGSNLDPATGGTGVLGTGYVGVRGETQGGTAVMGRVFGNGLAAQFQGNVEVDGRITGPRTGPLAIGSDVQIAGEVFGVTPAAPFGGTSPSPVHFSTGILVGPTDPVGTTLATFRCNVEVSGDITAHDLAISGGDCAEEFDLAASLEMVSPGTVMVLDDKGGICPSHKSYDKKVIGIIAGAGEYQPGIVLGKKRSQGARVPIALVGKVFCKVDATSSPIEAGDLVTTSSVPGHAMKAGNPLDAFGTIIGKALSALSTGQDLIPVLVSLQ